MNTKAPPPSATLVTTSGTPWNLPRVPRDNPSRGAAGGPRTVNGRRGGGCDLGSLEARYRHLFESSRDGILTLDADTGVIVDANPFLVKILDLLPGELIGKTLWTVDAFSGWVASPDAFEALKNREDALHDDLAFVTKQGRRVPVELATAVCRGDGTGVIQCTIRDVTEFRMAEEARHTTLAAVTQAISKTIESCDPYTSGHQHRVAAIATAIAEGLGLSEDAVQGIGTAGLLHDLGMISVPSEILARPCRLSPVEMTFIRMHPATGHQILKGIQFPWPVADAAYQHHERMDGSGYPRRLAGDDIILEARILGVADVVEAMASHRPYRPAMGIATALEEIESNAGTLYDRDVAGTCISLFQDKGFQIPFLAG